MGFFSRLQETLLGIVQKWWRPLTCLGLCGSVFVNMILIPLKKGIPIEFVPASTFVTAIVAAFAVREWGKMNGSSQ